MNSIEVDYFIVTLNRYGSIIIIMQMDQSIVSTNKIEAFVPFSGVASLILMLTSAASRVVSNSSGDDILAALESNSSGKFSHGPPNSLRSLASDALEDLRDDARLPRCTCRNADKRLCQPPPGDDVWVISSTSSASCSFSFFLLCK